MLSINNTMLSINNTMLSINNTMLSINNTVFLIFKKIWNFSYGFWQPRLTLILLMVTILSTDYRTAGRKGEDYWEEYCCRNNEVT